MLGYCFPLFGLLTKVRAATDWPGSQETNHLKPFQPSLNSSSMNSDSEKVRLVSENDQKIIVTVQALLW